jgi:hypothetical protein
MVAASLQARESWRRRRSPLSRLQFPRNRLAPRASCWLDVAVDRTPGPSAGMRACGEQVARRVRADIRFLRSAQLSTAAALRLRSFQTAILDRDAQRATRLLPRAKRKPATPWRPVSDG